MPAQGSAKQREYSLESALTFGVLMLSVVVLFVKFFWAAVGSAGTKDMPFFVRFTLSRVEDIHADWIVFMTVMIHVVRVKFGVAFLKYDTSYLNAGKRLANPKMTRFRNKFVLINALMAFLAASLVSSTYPPVIMDILLFGQAIFILYFDWYNRKQLFAEDIDKKANFLIIAGDIGFLLFAVGVMAFHFVVAAPLAATATGAPPTSPTGFEAFLISYFCLFAFAILEMLVLILAIETLFTYREGIKLAWREFTGVLVSG